LLPLPFIDWRDAVHNPLPSIIHLFFTLNVAVMKEAFNGYPQEDQIVGEKTDVLFAPRRRKRGAKKLLNGL